MNRRNGIEKIVFLLLIFMLCIKVSDSKALELPIPDWYPKEIEKLEAQYRTAEKELREIQVRILKDQSKNNQDTSRQETIYKKDLRRLIELLQILERIKKQMIQVREWMDNLFISPPPLKLVRISGPTPGVKNLVINLNPTFKEEIDYATNSAGYTRRVRNFQGQLISSSGIAVIYAPLEIIPGEPFHFEIEAREAAHWDYPQKCTPNDRVVMGLNVHSAIGIDTRSYSKADLRCEPGTVRISLRMKPGSPLPEVQSALTLQGWKFPYTLEVATSGDLKSRAKKETVAFRLKARKDAITLSDRAMYQVDVEVHPVSGETIGGPTLTLHYRAQEESIGFLPPYQFPADTSSLLIVVPDLKDNSRKEALEALTRRRLNADIRVGDPPSKPELAGKVATQSPVPGEKVKIHSTVNVTLHANYEDIVVVPPILNLSGKQAKSQIESARLTSEIEIGEPAPTQEKAGTVYRQDPAADVKVKPGTKIKMTLYSNFVETVVVPDLQRLSFDDARRKLIASGLSISRQDAGRPNQRGLADTFQKQDPPPGTKVSIGQAVRAWFYGSYAPPADVRQVPNVTGLSLADAKQALERSGLMPAPSLIGAAPTQGQSGRVTAQRPVAGTQVTPRSKVEIDLYGDYVPPRIGIPDVRGMTLPEAKNALRNAGFGVTPTLLGAAPSSAQARRVKTQSPAPGGAAAPGTTVQIEIWADYTPPRVLGPRISRHDLTGSYAKGAIKVTLENGRFIGRNYAPFLNTDPYRVKGYHTGMICFEVSTHPDIEETTRIRREGSGVGAVGATAYPGKVLISVNDKAAYVNGYLYAYGAIVDELNFRLTIQSGSMVKGLGNGDWHDSRSIMDSEIERIQ